MPDIIITSQFILQASVAAAGTLAIAYPANETKASMSARNFDTINLLSAGGRTYTGMTASYGSGSITLTNGSGYALPAGTYYVEFANPVEVDDATDGRPLARYGTDASGNTVLLGPDEEYELVSFPHWPIQVPAAANATTSAPGSLQGGVGDVLGKVDCLVNTPGATATLSVQDGTTGAVYTLSPSGGLAVAGFYSYDLGYTALVGPWRIICGAGLSAVANLL